MRQGFMQTDLIIATFSQHLVETVHAICPNPPMELCNDAPVGALLLASQAVSGPSFQCCTMYTHIVGPPRAPVLRDGRVRTPHQELLSNSLERLLRPDQRPVEARQACD